MFIEMQYFEEVSLASSFAIWRRRKSRMKELQGSIGFELRNPLIDIYHAVKGQNEASLGILLCWCAVTSIPPGLQVAEAVVGVVQHRTLIMCLLPATMAMLSLT